MGFSLSLQPSQPAHTRTCQMQIMQDMEPSLSALCLPYCPKNTCLALAGGAGFCNFYQFMSYFSLQDAAFFVAQMYQLSRFYSLLISAPLYSFSCPILLCNFIYSSDCYLYPSYLNPYENSVEPICLPKSICYKYTKTIIFPLLSIPLRKCSH